MRIYPDGTLDTETADQTVRQQPCFISTKGMTNALIRMQKNMQTKVFSCEIWNFDGTQYRSQVETITIPGPRQASGGTIGGGATGSLGFLRVAATLVPLGGRPPTTADGGDWTELKFDGNLRDSSGRNHNASGAATYDSTPDQRAFAYPRTAGAPSWTSWTSLRAGFPSQLDGSASFSLADASSSVSCAWTQLDGPSTVIWTNQNSTTPTLEGLIFGMYNFSLNVTDVAGNTASASLEVGAVATDDNGVVINADPNVDRIFGPMIAFGKNPWGFADERAFAATNLRAAAYKAQGYDPPSWKTPGNGTVTYIFNGRGGPAAARGTVLTSEIADSGATSISVEDASLLDLSGLPARISVGGNSPREEVRICAASATTGPATLTVCYDGRGQSSPADPYRAAARSWPKGTTVGQNKVQGSGTSFLSDICLAGPGPTGVPVYSEGSVRLTAGSTAVEGNSTAWSAASKVYPGYVLRVSATHGGEPFLFVAYIASLQNATNLVLARPYPADADSGSFTYSVVQADYRHLSLHYSRPGDASDAQTYFQTSGCESDTEAYVYAGHDIAELNGSLQSSRSYGYMEGFGLTSIFGPNFYGEDLAHRALYYRSGWTPALRAARVVSDNYVNSPHLSGGDVGGIPLLLGGGVIGGFAAAILDTEDPNRPKWTDLRGFAKRGSIGKSGCNVHDARDSGYLGAWLTLAAGFDPDPALRAEWQSRLQQLLVRDQTCKGDDNSWANGFLWTAASVPLTMTPDSPVVTGANIPQGLCYGVASGSMSVANGSAQGYGTGFVAGKKIAVTGTMGGLPYTGFFRFKVEADGSIMMSALWPGDSGAATWVIENNDNMTTIGVSPSDPQLKRNWACTWNSPSRITLNRPWDGPAVRDAHLYSYAVAGFGQQPFMVGIKLTQMKLASQLGEGSVADGYAALATQAANWIRDVGYDPVTQGMHYGRVLSACEPATVPPPGSSFDVRTPGCNYGLSPGAIRTARVLTAETSQALRVYYESNPSPQTKAWGDEAYGSIWGNPRYTTGGVYSDSNYVRDENSDGSLGAYKWTGFFFGMGMAHQWPAVRLGGLSPALARKVSLEVTPGVAARVRIAVVEPSSKVNVFACEQATSCEVTVDDRQGSHFYQVQYLSGDGKIASKTPWLLIPCNRAGAARISRR